MIELSERAAAKVRSMRDELGDDARHLRLSVEAGGCSGFQYGMAFDLPKPDDVKVEDHGVTLIVDPASHEYIKDSRIDFDDGLKGKGFEIINPGAQSTCGCGKSFN